MSTTDNTEKAISVEDQNDIVEGISNDKSVHEHNTLPKILSGFAFQKQESDSDLTSRNKKCFLHIIVLVL